MGSLSLNIPNTCLINKNITKRLQLMLTDNTNLLTVQVGGEKWEGGEISDFSSNLDVLAKKWGYEYVGALEEIWWLL